MSTFKELRKEKKITQFELAKQLEIDQTTVSKWELEKALPDTAMLIRLADYFDVSIDYLLSRSEYYYPDRVLQNNSPTAAPTGDTGHYSKEERKLIDDYRKLNVYKQELIRNNIKAMLPAEAESERKKDNIS